MKHIFIYITLMFILISCKERFTPKPTGYMRFDFIKKESKKYKIANLFSFYSADYYRVKTQKKNNSTWIDLSYKKHNATIHLTHSIINNNLSTLIEEARSMVYKHTIKADAIHEKNYSNIVSKSFGKLYDIKGQSASAVQFYLTDSTNHFLRGSLYFYTHTNPDSLAPVIKYIRNDIMTIMETIEWVKTDGI